MNITKKLLTLACSAGLAFGATADELPSAYTAIEYIESTGSQIIDTGVYPSPTLRAEMDFVPTEHTGDVNLGAFADGDNQDWRVFSYSGGICFDNGSTRVGQKNPLSLGLRYLVDVGGEASTMYMAITNVADSSEFASYTGSRSGTVGTSKPVCVFGGYASSTQTKGAKMRLYSLKLYDYAISGDETRTLLRDFVPCTRDEDDVAGLYDFVTGAFFTNIGSGTFVVPAVTGEVVAASVTACSNTEELYFENRKLGNVLDIGMTCYQAFGGIKDTRKYVRSSGPVQSGGTYNKSGLYLYTNNGKTLTVEFHGLISYGSYGGIGNGFKLQLTQKGDDIYGQVLWYVGTTGINAVGMENTWEGKKKSSWTDWDNLNVTYSTFCHDLELTFGTPLETERVVTFKDKEGDTIEARTVAVGELTVEAPTPTAFEGYVFYTWDRDFSLVQKDMTVTALYHKLCTVQFLGKNDEVFNTQTIEETKDATEPAAETIPTYAGFKFYAWDKPFTNIVDDTDVHALYHKLCNVTFKDADGSTLKEEIVEETYGATAPDMSGKVYDDCEFQGWDKPFDVVTNDLLVTAVYADRPFSPVSTEVWFSGLKQGKLDKSNDFTTDFVANSTIPVEVAPGTVMADVPATEGNYATQGYTNEYTGTVYHWNRVNTTFGYSGYVWLNADDQINFAKNLDDSAYIVIDGTEVMKNTDCNSYIVKSYTATESKWHAIEVRVADGSGGKGPQGRTGAISPLGLAYNINGLTTQAAYGWYAIRDAANDMSFLRASITNAPYLMMGKTKNVGGNLVVELGAQNLPAPAKLVAFYGAADGGEFENNWLHKIELATLPAGDSGSTTYTLNGLCNHAAVRFALFGDGTETTQAFAQYTPLKSYTQVAPLGSVVIGEIGASHTNNVDVIVACEAIGAGASSATVTFEISEDGTFEDARQVVAGTVTEVGAAPFNLPGLSAASTYYVRVIVANEAASYTSETKMFATYDPYLAHPGDTLTWNGGATGTWDTTTKCWTMPFGDKTVSVAWVDGCTAFFPSAVNMTVSGAKSVLGFRFGADVVFGGDAITLTSASVVYTGDAQVVFNNDFNGTAGLTPAREEIVYPAIFETDVCVGTHLEGEKTEKIHSETNAPALWFRNARLSDVNNIRGDIKGIFGGINYRKLVDLDSNDSRAGVFYYSNDGQTLTCQFQANGGYACFNCVKVELTQVGDDVYGRVVYVRAKYDNVKLGDNFDEIDSHAYETHLYNLSLVIQPVDCGLTFNGAYDLTGDHTLTYGTLTFGETATFKASGLESAFTIYDHDVIFACTTEQTVKSKIQSKDESKSLGRVRVLKGANLIFNGNKGGNWFFDIEGTVSATGYTTLPQGSWYREFMTRALPGSVVSLGSGYYQIGFNGSAPFCIYTNALVKLTSTGWESPTMGTGKPFKMYGGTITNATDVDQMFHTLYMSNGARFVGGQASVGGGNGSYNPGANWANLEVGGETPSFFETDIFRFGFVRAGDNSAGASRVIGIKFNVADVTGDDRTDFTVTSRFVDKENQNTATTPYVVTGYRTNRGFWKTGAGTMEITGAGSTASSGVVKMEQGTLRIGEGASGNLGALYVVGDSTIDCAGGTMSFDDSSEVEWTEGATLVLSGDLGKKTLRVGTSGASLTAAQIGQIKYRNANGKLKPVTLSDDGYILPPSGALVIVVE